MHMATLIAFRDELVKIAGFTAGALDAAGLGMLAAPTIQKMRGKPMQDKNKDRMELAGLGTLGASVAAEHAPSALQKLKGLAGKLPKPKFAAVKQAGPSMSSMMVMHRLADAAKAAKGGAQAAPKLVKLPTQAAQMQRSQSLAGHVATGGHAWNPAMQARRAISL